MINNKKSICIETANELDSMPIADVSKYIDKFEQHLIDHVNWPNVYSYCPEVNFSMVHSSQYIYVKFRVRGEDLRAVNTINLSPVAQDSCVEFFLQVPGNPEYWNFEFNCIGTVNASHRVTRPEAVRLNDSQIASIKRFSSCGTSPFEERNGIFSWSLTIAIPKSLVGIEPSTNHIMANLYKCADKTSHPHYISWNPILTDKPNFHNTEYFGNITLK